MFGSLILLGLALLDYGVWSLVFAVIGLNLFKAVAFNTQKRYCYWPLFSFVDMRHFLTFGGHITLTRTLWYIYSEADILIGGRILGKELLGVYSVAMRLVSLPLTKASMIFTQIGLSTFSRIQNNQKAVQRSFLKILRVANVFSFPLFIGFAITAPDIIPLILTAKWAVIILPVQMLCFVMPLRFVSVLFPPIITGTGHPQVITKNMITAVIIMPLAFLFGSKWGVVGLCYAWLLAFPILFLIMTQRVLKILLLPWRKFLDTFFAPLISSSVMFIGIKALKWYIGDSLSDVLIIIMLIIAGMILYLSTLLLINRSILTEVKLFFSFRE